MTSVLNDQELKYHQDSFVIARGLFDFEIEILVQALRPILIFRITSSRALTTKEVPPNSFHGTAQVIAYGLVSRCNRIVDTLDITRR